MTGQGLWLQYMLPLSLLVVGHVLLVTKRFVVTERGKEGSDAQSAANARMLGLAFQGQGQLDMAFDYFPKVPLHDTLMHTPPTLPPTSCPIHPPPHAHPTF